MFDKLSVPPDPLRGVSTGDDSLPCELIIKRLGRVVEVYSIAEAFVRLTDMVSGPLAASGQWLRRIVSRWSVLPVPVGHGATKTFILKPDPNHSIALRTTTHGSPKLGGK
jgi:hypothetical protein